MFLTLSKISKNIFRIPNINSLSKLKAFFCSKQKLYRLVKCHLQYYNVCYNQSND